MIFEHAILMLVFLGMHTKTCKESQVMGETHLLGFSVHNLDDEILENKITLHKATCVTSNLNLYFLNFYPISISRISSSRPEKKHEATSLIRFGYLMQKMKNSKTDLMLINYVAS